MNTQRLQPFIYSVIAFAAMTCVSGCVVAPTPAYYQPNVVYSDDLPPPVYADIPPPAPQVEVIGVPPAPGYFWISGVWFWEGGRHVWHPGRWSAPRPGYNWAPHRWQQDGKSWRMDGGHWVRPMNSQPIRRSQPVRPQPIGPQPINPRPGRY